MKVKILAIVFTIFVLCSVFGIYCSAAIVPPLGSQNMILNQYNQPMMSPSQDLIGPVSPTQDFRIGGSWEIRIDPENIRLLASDFSEIANSGGWLIVSGIPTATQGDYYGLWYSINNEIFVNDGLMFRIELDPDDATKAIITEIRAHDAGGSSMLLWDSNNGFVELDYRKLNFSNIPQRITYNAWRVLVSLLTPDFQENIEIYPNHTGATDFTKWLFTAVGGFFDFQITSGFTIGDMLGAIVGVSVVILFLKFVAGG